MRQLVMAVFALIAVNSFSAPNIVTVGQSSGQIYNEFNNSWTSRPIIVSQTNDNQTILQIGNMTIVNGRGSYQASCVLNQQERERLIKLLETGYRLTREDQEKNKDIEVKLGSFIRGEGDTAHGLKVLFFRKDRVLNPTGVILFIRDNDKDYHCKLYIYPSQLQQLIQVLQNCSQAYK